MLVSIILYYTHNRNTYLYPAGNNVIDKQLPLGLCHPGELLVALPQVEEQAKRHQPNFIPGEMELADAVIEKSGEQLLVCYPTCAFFVSGSLSTLRLVPL